MRITQGTFSHLPELTDEQIEAQLRYAVGRGWAVMVEHTDDPHPRNALWEMWAPPQFDLIEDDEDIAILVLAAATSKEGPGPLVSSIARNAGDFPIPVAIVPGHLSDEELDAMS